jgi:hypothetical protein
MKTLHKVLLSFAPAALYIGTLFGVSMCSDSKIGEIEGNRVEYTQMKDGAERFVAYHPMPGVDSMWIHTENSKVDKACFWKYSQVKCYKKDALIMNLVQKKADILRDYFNDH